MAVIPNVMGICTWSPPLDSRGNSLRGIEFMEVMCARKMVLLIIVKLILEIGKEV